MAGLLDSIDFNDPKTAGLLNLGLGILAGNTGRPGDMGQGLMSGLQNYQQQMAQQQRQKMLDQQFQQDQELFGLKKAEAEREAKAYQLQQEALDRASASNPALADLYRLDPKAAIKATFPQAGGADPYFSPVPTEQGLAWFDHRTGKLQLIDNQGPVIKSSDSPLVRGAVKGAESQAAAEWKPNTDIEGMVTTDANVVRDVNRLPTNNFSTPYPVTMGAPGTTATDRREGTTGDIPLRSPFNQRQGIRVPTKAELAADEKRAVTSAESAAKKEATMSGIGDIINEARTVLSGNVKPTSSGFGAVLDTIGTAVGISPEGAAESDRLKAIGGALVAKMPRMEGPQSNYDVENYKIMAGDVGNPTIPIERRLAALDQVEKLWNKYDKSKPSSPAQKTVVRRGKYGGKTVIQYSDGSIEYAN